MKRLVVMLSMLALVVVLGGCATKAGNGVEGENVKCPACGYEFNVPGDPES